MCTLTYIPFGINHRIITSNRDESRLRLNAISPQEYNLYNKKLIFPKDPVGGGSWIVTQEGVLTACLLNGAFNPHPMKNSYRKSRGLIVLELFSYKNMFLFCRDIDLSGIEPFTLVMFSKENIVELKWTGVTKNIKFYDPALPHIWASEQLYSKINIEKRKNWFLNLIANNELNQNKIVKFHMNAGEGDRENDMVMRRANTVETVSITSVEVLNKNVRVNYRDLLNKSESYIELK